MANGNNNLKRFSFFLKIVLPVFLAVGVFAASVFAIIIPAFKKRIMDDKKEMIRELTYTAWSILEESEAMRKEGKMSKEEAQKKAILRVKDLHYGKNRKDYFWIIDMRPIMIAHPYRPELEGQNLNDFEDLAHKKLFREFVKVVKKQGSGYVTYMWQWKDDPKRIELKLSYVKGFKPWGWIIGTGIYMEDLKHEISAMTNRIIAISLLVLALIFLLLFFVTQQSLKIERKKEQAEKNLIESREKYKTLVDASTEGFIMLLEGKYFYSNQAVLNMLGYTNAEMANIDLRNIIAEEGQQKNDSLKNYLEDLLAGKDIPMQYEAKLRKKNGSLTDTLLSGSSISFSGKEGCIIIVKDVSAQKLLEQKKLEDEKQKLVTELQTALLFLHQPLKCCFKEIVSCKTSLPIKEAAKLMTSERRSSILIKSDNGDFVGIVTDRDISMAVANGRNLNAPASEIMSSPLISIPEQALIFEAAIMMQDKKIRHLTVKDKSGKIINEISNNELLQVQRYSPASMIHEIGAAASPDEIASSRGRLPLLIKALVDCGVDAKNITRINTSISDLILNKFIKFAIDELGEPPVWFTFVTMGSEGRMEETLCTDQDNAIIHEDLLPEQEKIARKYFEKLAEKVCGWLEKAGYKRCEGLVMATNPKWRCSLSEWKKHFSTWITSATPQNLLEFNIFFDFRAVYGDRQLSKDLKKHINELLNNTPPFFLLLAENCLLYNPPIGMFGKISVKTSGKHADTFSIKEAMKPLINFARIYSLKHEINTTNTLARLDGLFEKGIITESTHNEMAHVYNFLMRLRFSHQASAISDGNEPDNHINPKNLTNIEREILKKTFSQIAACQTKLSFDFKGVG